jgi:hypothetical protein
VRLRDGCHGEQFANVSQTPRGGRWETDPRPTTRKWQTPGSETDETELIGRGKSG